MKKSLIISAVSALALCAAVAQAEVVVTSRSGSWSTLGGTADDGTRMCGVEVRGHDKRIMIKYFAGQHDLIVHLAKLSWSIPRGTRVPVEVSFDGHSPWVAVAGGTSLPEMVEFNVKPGSIKPFMEELRWATSMTVHFPAGSETDWSADMTGSNAAAMAWARCVVTTLPRTDAPSQPFSDERRPQAPTQPFSGVAAPTKPREEAT